MMIRPRYLAAFRFPPKITIQNGTLTLQQIHIAPPSPGIRVRVHSDGFSSPRTRTRGLVTLVFAKRTKIKEFKVMRVGYVNLGLARDPPTDLHWIHQSMPGIELGYN